MALGNQSNYNNTKKEEPQSNTYSAYSFANAEGIDPSRLGFTFWNQVLKITIHPRKADGEGYDKDGGVAIYLHHLKARMFAEEISKFIESPTEFPNVGVHSSDGFISLERSVSGSKLPCVVIRKIDTNGATESTFAYELRGDHFAIRNFEPSSNEFDKVYYKNLELEAFRQLLIDYANSMSGALAHSITEFSKYQTARRDNAIKAIGDKLGVQDSAPGKGGNAGSKNTANSLFANGGRSFDDIE